MKGVAGNIGISEVQSAAQKLEKAIREGHDSVSALLDEFASLLGTQVHAIEKALHASAPARVRGSADFAFQWRSGMPARSRGSGPCLRRVTVIPKRRFAACRMQ